MILTLRCTKTTRLNKTAPVKQNKEGDILSTWLTAIAVFTMDAFMKKVRKKQSPLNDLSEADVDTSEMALEDDDPFSSSGFAGKLMFAGGDGDFAKDFEVTGTGNCVEIKTEPMAICVDVTRNTYLGILSIKTYKSDRKPATKLVCMCV